MKKVLIIEDDHRLSESISTVISKEGLKSESAFDGQMALKFFSNNEFDLIVLDVNLPKINGMDLCRKFREVNPTIPILIITAFSDIDTKMEAFDIGADDYLVKPFHLKELAAKIKVFIKRASTVNLPQNIIEFMNIKIDPNLKNVVREGKLINLTPKEYALFEYLMRNRNRIVSKDELARNVWDENYGVTHNTIEVYINFLRNKIDKDFDTKLILTKPGFGYYLGTEH